MREHSPIFSLVFLMGIALLLHGIWEHTHIVLYTGYGQMEGALPVWMLATLGDLLYTLIIIGTISLSKGTIAWLRYASRHEYLAAAALGFLVALMVEYKGLYLGRWEYLPSMPLIPMLNVGFSPLLQMTVLTPLSLLCAKVFAAKLHAP